MPESLVAGIASIFRDLAICRIFITVVYIFIGPAAAAGR